MTQNIRQPGVKRIRLTVTLLSIVILAMGGLVWASVPLYEMFCRVTGFGGTTQVAEQEASEILDRVVKVRFNADVASGLPWGFTPAQREVTVRVGETGMAYYKAVNHSPDTIIGTATYNVTPAKAGLYFSKIECFCFIEQTLAPGEEAELAVTFFVDPEIADDENMGEIKTITLSYTFFEKSREISDLGSGNSDETPAIVVANLDSPVGVH